MKKKISNIILQSQWTKLLCLFPILFTFTGSSFSQDGFVHIRNSKFVIENEEFNFLGINAYYLYSIYHSRNRYVIDEVFNTANSTGFKVIRLWAFFESDNRYTRGTIRYAPHAYNIGNLRGLDYIIQKAKEKNIKLILVLANNHPEYGGIPQYIGWANNYLNSNSISSFNHNDFFTNDSIKAWYKDYLKAILNCTNTFTNIKYKNEPAIFSFELINEAENIGFNSSVLKNWYNDMSQYFKSIDSQHLLTTGEQGYDINENNYSNIGLFYNSADFLFNGTKGTSFYENTRLSTIDYSSYHLYPDQWQMNPIAGITWIKDHMRISKEYYKPALLGEFGVKDNKLLMYTEYLEMFQRSECKSAIVWNYIHPSLNMSDEFGINEFDNPELFNLFKQHIERINSKDSLSVKDGGLDAELLQNYPNPFNPATEIIFKLSNRQYIKLELYDTIGQLVAVLDEGFRRAGEHKVSLSFNNYLLPSGLYIYSLRTASGIISKKLLLLK